MCLAAALAAASRLLLKVILGDCLGVESLWSQVFSPFSDITLSMQSGGTES